MLKTSSILFIPIALLSARGLAAVTVTARDSLTTSGAHIARTSGEDTIAEQDIAFDIDVDSSIVSGPVTIGSSSNGSLTSDATTIASVKASIGLSSTLTNSGSGLSYALTSNQSTTLTSGDLSLYAPAPSSQASVSLRGGYNAGLGFNVDTLSNYSITLGLSVVENDNQFNSAVLYLDANNNGTRDNLEVQFQSFTVAGAGSQTVNGTLTPAAAGVYRLSFFGNGLGGTNVNFDTLTSSGTYTASFSVTPEPGALTLLAAGTTLLLRRRR